MWLLVLLWGIFGGDGYHLRKFSAKTRLGYGPRLIVSPTLESTAEADVVSREPDLDTLGSIEVAGSDGVKATTAAGGRKHTAASKAKIAQANKGKKPWNVGKKHSEETKARIAERTKIAMAKRKQEKLDAMGMTLEEYNESREKKIKEKRKAKAKGGLTPEGRKRISESVKKRWEDPAYRERYTLANRGNRNHSEETKAKISAAIKAKWEDQEYRAKVNTSSHRPSKDVRERISQTLKKKWQDPEFREKMLKNTHERNDEWKHKVSDKIRELWKDPNYRNNVQQGIMASSSGRTVRPAGAKRKSPAASKRKIDAAAKKAKAAAAEALVEKKRLRTFCLGALQHLVLHPNPSEGSETEAAGGIVAAELRWMMGAEMWFEEKMRRRQRDKMPLMGDDDLGEALMSELLCGQHTSSRGVTAAAEVSMATKSEIMSALAACRRDQGQQGSYVNWAGLLHRADIGGGADAGAAAPDTGMGRLSPPPFFDSSPGNADSVTISDEAQAGLGPLLGEGTAPPAEVALLTEKNEAEDASGGSEGPLAMAMESDYDEEDEEDLEMYEDEYDDYEMQEELEDQEDVIEVYDESGNLVGTYTDAEWASLKKSERG